MSIDWLRKPNMDPVYYCNVIDLFYCAKRDFQQYFSYIMAISFSGGGSRSTRRELPTMGKQLVNFYHLQLRVECTLNNSTNINKTNNNWKKRDHNIISLTMQVMDRHNNVAESKYI
jgi:hypothetical protein